MRYARLTLAIVALGSLSASIALSDTIAARTNLSGTLTEPITTGTAYVEQRFTLQVTPPFPGDALWYRGATVQGHVARVVRAGAHRRAELFLAFDSLRLADGKTMPLAARVVHVYAQKKGAVPDGKVSGVHIRTLVHDVLARVTDADLGGSVGSAGGLLYAARPRVDFTVPSDATVVLHLDRLASPTAEPSVS
ncbi:MAG TPA: hypothetical protein VME66_02200 [Candidatus Acidoferrales bacterium]|nr:hypothetical protein [Candidatus Acidoferrales bacterium]